MLMKWMACATLVVLPLCTEASQLRHAQTSVGLTRSEPEAQYRLIKEHLSAAIAKNRDILDPDLDWDGRYDLYSCRTPEMFTGALEEEAPEYHLEGLALDELTWQHQLSFLGYPREAWVDLLAQYEKSTLAWLRTDQAKHHKDINFALEERKSKFLKKLATSLNSSQYRNRTLPPVYIEGGCGDGGVFVKITTNPLGGRVWLIPRFYFDLCRAQGLDQKNIEQCDRWKEIALGEEIMLVGNYKFTARWPDGTTKMSDYSAPKLEGEGDAHVFIIRK